MYLAVTDTDLDLFDFGAMIQYIKHNRFNHIFPTSVPILDKDQDDGTNANNNNYNM